MGRLPLFDPEEGVLSDDERGRIEYRRVFLDPREAEAWFVAVRAAATWKAERRRMYDRDVDVPRLTAHFHLSEGQPASVVPEVLREPLAA